MARYIEGNVSIADNEYDFREVCKALGVPKQKAIKLAQTTVNNISRKMRDEGIEGSLSKYYNTYRQGEDVTLNAFLTDTTLQPIAHLFRLKCNIKISREAKRSREFCTFTMLKSHYDYYREHGKPPNVSTAGRISKYGTKQRTLIKFDGGGNVKVPINETWKRFKSGIQLYNKKNGTKYSLAEMVLVALEEYMQNRDSLFPTKNVTLRKSDIIETDTTNINIMMDAKLGNDMRAFVQRYNALNTPKTSVREVVIKSIRSFLDRMPIIYTNPELYAEEQMLKQKKEEFKNAQNTE